VQAAGLARIRPMRGGGYWDALQLPGYPKRIPTGLNFVTAGYLGTLGVPVLSGRDFTVSDVSNAAAVAIVSEDIAKQIGRSPLGLTFEIENKTVEIVGVAASARYSRLTEQPSVVYLPNSLTQDSTSVLVRTAVAPSQVLEGVRQAIAELDPNLPMVKPVTMEQQIASTLRLERLFAWLCGAFAVLALVLCMIGLYGVMSYAIARRTQEIGIRMALGASPAIVLRHVMGEGLAVALAGCAVGVPIAWWAAQRYVDYKKLGMDPLDPTIIGWATAALGISALLAVLGPAFRAASADPMSALREG
jgi:ABC-type antimicrobial peptide transport system permease subunit